MPTKGLPIYNYETLFKLYGVPTYQYQIKDAGQTSKECRIPTYLATAVA